MYVCFSVEHLHKELLEQKSKSLEEMKHLQEQAFQDQQRTYEQHITQLLERMEKERGRAREDNERVLEAKLKVRSDNTIGIQCLFIQFFVYISTKHYRQNMNMKNLVNLENDCV